MIETKIEILDPQEAIMRLTVLIQDDTPDNNQIYNQTKERTQDQNQDLYQKKDQQVQEDSFQ